MITIKTRSCFHHYHLVAIGVLYYFYLDCQGITCFPSQYLEAEVTLLQPRPDPTLWCFNVQCFYVFSVSPDDGATQHQNMSG
jgi:hypothetical protein